MSEEIKTLPADARSLPEYEEGRQAFFSGNGEDDNPHTGGTLGTGSFNSRVAWFTGYFDERTRTRLRHVFQRYDVAWP